ncbi:MAG: hypothetical protein H7331_09270 [Bacteroidia bacterium]|nr:hypothetical protein [Bacteroidia bacterium]
MVPKSVSNNFFRKQYTGVYNADLSANYLLGKKQQFYMGFGADFKRFQSKDSYVSVRTTSIENKKKPAVTSSALSGLLQVGYWKNDGSSLVIDYSLGVGIMQTTNTTPIDSFPASNVVKGYTLQPKVGFYWYVDEDKLMLLGCTIGYTYVNTRFDADALHYKLLSKVYTAQDVKLNTQYISFGLGLIYRIGKPSGNNDFE